MTDKEGLLTLDILVVTLFMIWDNYNTNIQSYFCFLLGDVAVFYGQFPFLCVSGLCYLFFFGQGLCSIELSIWPKVALNSGSPCLSLVSAKISAMCLRAYNEH